MHGAFLLFCLTQADVPSATPAEDVRGRIQTRTYTFKQARREMEYTLYVPNSYDKQRKSPLVVALHGLASNPRQIIRYPGLITQAEKHGYIVVAPMGYSPYGWYGSRGRGGTRSSDPDNLGELSEKDVLNVLAIVRETYQIDDRRIYLLGHSMGGSGTWHLAIKYPQIWAAISPLAPTMARGPDALVKAKHIPVIVVQGDQDKLVYSTRRWVAKMKELNMEHRYIEVAGGGHVRIVFAHFPEVFEFFNAHTKPETRRSDKITAGSAARNPAADD
jgi:predicted peptidase